MYYVFVFGTLKEGFPNFKSNKGRRLQGEFTTKDSYPLYLVGERNSPWLIMTPNEGHNVSGQVFEVGGAALAEMDRLERITAPDGYRRVEIQVVNEKAEEMTVFVYMKPAINLNFHDVNLGPLSCYDLEHAETYRSRKL